MSPSEYQEAEKMFKLQPNHQNECWHCLFLETMDFVKIGFNFQLSVVTLQYFKFKKTPCWGSEKIQVLHFPVFSSQYANYCAFTLHTYFFATNMATKSPNGH